jgi:hypothetical protein
VIYLICRPRRSTPASGQVVMRRSLQFVQAAPRIADAIRKQEIVETSPVVVDVAAKHKASCKIAGGKSVAGSLISRDTCTVI